MALAGKYGFLAQIPSISKIKNSITETSRQHYKQLAKAQQTKVISTGLWDINLLYARTYLQADKKQAYRSERPCFPRKKLKSGALDSNFYTTQQSRKSRKRMPWVASVKTLAARPSSKREVHTKIPNSKLLITTISYTLSKKQAKAQTKNYLVQSSCIDFRF